MRFERPVALIMLGLWLVAAPLSAKEASPLSESFEQEYQRLQQGRQYSNAVDTGLIYLTNQSAQSEMAFTYAIDVPENYDASRRYPVHVLLHGGVNMSREGINQQTIGYMRKLALANAIIVYPSAWPAAKWWYQNQALNIQQILDQLKHTYNLDENRVYLQGVSDGATGTFYFASHLPTPFAAFAGYIGSPRQLSPQNNVYGATFLNNFVNKPILAVNTRRDRLYPVAAIEPFYQRVNELGGDITFYPMRGGHELDWYKKLRDEIEVFIADHTRQPHPQKLRWQIDQGGEFNRIHWLILNAPIDPNQPAIAQVEQKDNGIYLDALNVDEIRLLLSPDQFDFTRNIQIYVNNQLVADKRFVPDIEILRKWAKIDNDRTMLYASEVSLALH